MELMPSGRCCCLPLYFYPRLRPQPALKHFNLSLCQNFPKRKIIGENFFLIHSSKKKKNQKMKLSFSAHIPAAGGSAGARVPQGVGGSASTPVGWWWRVALALGQGLALAGAIPALVGAGSGLSHGSGGCSTLHGPCLHPQTGRSTALPGGAELSGVCWAIVLLLPQGEKTAFGLPAQRSIAGPRDSGSSRALWSPPRARGGQDPCSPQLREERELLSRKGIRADTSMKSLRQFQLKANFSSYLIKK